MRVPTTIGLGRRAVTAAETPAGLADYLVADLLDPKQAERAVRATAPDRVFHLAAEASVARSWEDPAGAILSNLSGTLNLLEAVRRHAPDAARAGRLLRRGVRRARAAAGRRGASAPPAQPLRGQQGLRRPRGRLLRRRARPARRPHARVQPRRARAERRRTWSRASRARSPRPRRAGDGGSVEVRDRQPRRRAATSPTCATSCAPTGSRSSGAEPGRLQRLQRQLASRSAISSPRSRASRRSRSSSATDPARLREHEVMEIRGSHDKLTERDRLAARDPARADARATRSTGGGSARRRR